MKIVLGLFEQHYNSQYIQITKCLLKDNYLQICNITYVMLHDILSMS